MPTEVNKEEAADGATITWQRVRGGGCFDSGGVPAKRTEIGVVDLPSCASQTYANKLCAPFFEWDTATGSPGNGWCGCGGVGGNNCTGTDEPASTSSIYHIIAIPASRWGADFLIATMIVLVLYAGIGFALGRKQGRLVAGGATGVLTVHPHFQLWQALGGMVQDGCLFSVKYVQEKRSGGSASGPAVDDKSGLLGGGGDPLETSSYGAVGVDSSSARKTHHGTSGEDDIVE